MPRDISANEIADLKAKDLPLLHRFREQAKIEISRMMELDPKRIPMFLVGFHVIPSLFPLHCHVLDWSFSTGNAYHPRHWKIQFSNMFIALDRVIEELEQTGRISVDVKAYQHDWQTKPIRCPVCPGPQLQWEGDVKMLARHWAAHVDEWKSTKNLPPNVGSYRQWEPVYPVILTTRKRGPSIGLDKELDHLKRLFPSLEIHRYFSDEWASIPQYILDKTTIYFHTTELPPAGFRLPRLEWIQLFSSGTDQLTHSHYNNHPNICVTSAKGAGSVAIAEWLVMSTLVLTRRILTALHNQVSHNWSPGPLMGHRTLSQLSIGIVGYGHVGQQTADRFLALGARKVTAVNKRGVPQPRPTTLSPRLNDVRVRRLENKEALHEFLRKTDVLILAAPLTSETRGLIGVAELAALPAGAVVLNISRGPLLDESALANALRSGKLGGAALDVVTNEPLGAKSELWDLPNVIITPHISTMHDQV
jgi:phosphoglycerate dehydrogenase-like enzyme